MPQPTGHSVSWLLVSYSRKEHRLSSKSISAGNLSKLYSQASLLCISLPSPTLPFFAFIPSNLWSIIQICLGLPISNFLISSISLKHCLSWHRWLSKFCSNYKIEFNIKSSILHLLLLVLWELCRMHFDYITPFLRLLPDTYLFPSHPNFCTFYSLTFLKLEYNCIILSSFIPSKVSHTLLLAVLLCSEDIMLL